MGCRKSSSNRKVYSNTDLPHEKKIHINSLTLYLKHLEKRKSPKLVEGRNQYRSEYK